MLEGAAEIKRRLRQIRDAKLAALSDGLKVAGDILLGESDLIVPVDVGSLRGTEFVKSSGDNSTNPVVTVGYASPYAVYVHEIRYHHRFAIHDDKGKRIGGTVVTHGEEFNIKHAAEIARGPATGPYRKNRGSNQVYKFLEKPFRENLERLKMIIAHVISEAR